MAYGPKQRDIWKHIARIANRIFAGESPATIPIERDRDIEFVVNIKTAMRIGYSVPSTLLITVDSVIED
jgi:putative tryptophan/tyrosine transport system substrate-binding protein